MTQTAAPRPVSAARSGIVQTGLFIVMETAWIAALALFVDTVIAGQGSLAVVAVCALYPVGLLAEHLVNRARLPEWGAWATHATAFCLAAFVMVLFVLPEGERLWGTVDPILAWLVEDHRGQRLLALLCLGLFCWVRGALLSRGELNAYVVALGFQIGLAVLLTVLAFSHGFDLVWPGASALSLTFILAGLLALWHVRASTQAGRGRTARRNPGAALLGLAMVVVLGLGLAAGFDRGVLEMLLALTRRIGEFIGAVILYLFSLLPAPDTGSPDMPEMPEMPMPTGPQEPAPVMRTSDMFRRIYAIVFFGLIAIAVAVILFANLRALLAWLRKRRDHTPGLDYDRSAHGLADTLRRIWQELREALQAMLSHLRDRLHFRRREAPPDEPIRRAWLRLENQLDQRGWPRRTFETPFDYARRMKAEWPDPGSDLATLTRAYVNARYGRARRVPAERLRKFVKKIGRSLNKVRQRETDADNAGRHTQRN